MNVPSLGGAMSRYGFTDVSKTGAIEISPTGGTRAKAIKSGLRAGLVAPMGLH
jgi:hypothetical protein